MKKYIILIIFMVIPVNAFAQNLVGVGVPLSGDGAWMGKNVLDGINLYLKQNNILPETSLKIEDVSYSQANTTSGITAVRKLGEVNKVSAMILCNSPVVNASSEFIDEKKIPTVAIVGAETAKDRNYQVRMWPLPEDEMLALVNHIKGKRIAILYSEQDSMIARKTSFEKTLGTQGEIAYSSSVEIDSFNSIALRVLQAKPEVVILFLMPGKNGLVAKKLREMNYKGLFAGSVAINSEDEIKLSNKALVGAIFPDAAMTDDFVKSFKDEYGYMPGVGSAPGYDAAKLIFEELKKMSGDVEKFNKAIHAEKFSGAMGSFGILKNGSNSFKVPVAIRKVEG